MLSVGHRDAAVRRSAQTPVEAKDELRPVSVLFADVVGSTPLAERLAPEDYIALIGGCVDRMCRAVEQFGGVIDAYMGDGIAAFFGFPAATEDDADRAASAALSLVEAIDGYAEEVRANWRLPEFNVRVGVNSGQVAIGVVGAAERHPVALGDTLNVAARLQSGAEPGTIVIGGATARKLRGRFLMAPLGHLAVRGREGPVEAWRLLSARPDRPRQRACRPRRSNVRDRRVDEGGRGAPRGPRRARARRRGTGHREDAVARVAPRRVGRRRHLGRGTLRLVRRPASVPCAGRGSPRLGRRRGRRPARRHARTARPRARRTSVPRLAPLRSTDARGEPARPVRRRPRGRVRSLAQRACAGAAGRRLRCTTSTGPITARSRWSSAS